MSFLASQHHLFTTRITFNYCDFKHHNLSSSLHPHQPIISCHVRNPSHSPNIRFNVTPKPQNFTLKAYQSDETLNIQQNHLKSDFNFDYFLLITELLCFASSFVVTVSYAVNCTFLNSKNTVLGFAGSSNKVVAWGLVVMTCGLVIGSWIRRRQWARVFSRVTEGGVNLIERIEKLEKDLKSCATIVRALSRQLEKLGIRFRVTRRSLKDPIAQTAALAQKNSEATRALAMQEDILEKELGEIQKVLLAMQEQQQKQLELILAIGKSGKLWESRPEPGQRTTKSDVNTDAKNLENHETQGSGASKVSNNDRP